VTRQNLSRRIIVDPGGISCVFCNESIDSVSHLFIRFSFLGQVWYHVFKLLRLELVLPFDLRSLLSFTFELGGGKGEVWFLINLTNCCVVLVEILTRSHLFGQGYTCAPFGDYS